MSILDAEPSFLLVSGKVSRGTSTLRFSQQNAHLNDDECRYINVMKTNVYVLVTLTDSISSLSPWY